MKHDELISAYISAQLTNAEEEVRILQQRTRYRRIDINDSYELQYALAKHETLLQVSKDIYNLLQIREK